MPRISLAQGLHGLQSRIEVAAAEWAGQGQTRSWHSPATALDVQLMRLQGKQEVKKMLVPSSPGTLGSLRDLIKVMAVIPAPCLPR